MVISSKKTIAGVSIASALSFVLYAFAFEPYGMAELAYIFAIPAIIACKIFFVENKEYRKVSLAYIQTKNEKSKKFYGQILSKFSRVRKIYLLTIFVCSYLSSTYLPVLGSLK